MALFLKREQIVADHIRHVLREKGYFTLAEKLPEELAVSITQALNDQDYLIAHKDFVN